MGVFGDTPEEIEDETQNSSSIVGYVAAALVFLPSVFSALAFYLLLRKGRQRLTVIFSLLIIYELFLFLLWKATDAGPQFIATLGNFTALGEQWQSLLPAVSIFYLALGGLVGFGLSWLETRQMKANPHRLVIEGNWMYNFSYRRTPLQFLRRKKRIELLKKGAFVDEEKAPLGLDEENNDEVVARYNSEAIKHSLLVGATGSGKTLTMQSLIRADILNCVPTIVIDFKRSPEFASRLAAWTQEAGGNFYHFVNGELEDYDIKRSEGQTFYDPLAGGTPTSKADMVLGMREYDSASAVYKSNMQQLLQVVFSMLYYADKRKAPSIKWESGGIYQLASAVAGDNFKELAIACEGTPIAADAEEVAAQTKGRTGISHAMEELRGQLRTIIASEYGRWMKTSATTRGIDLFKLTQQESNVILFSLNSDSEPEFARYVGSMIMADLTATSAKRRNEQLQNHVSVYIDEFQAVNPSTVTGLLEKSRESRMALTLAQQSFEQIVAAAESNGEAYLLSVLDTCSNFIVHAGATEDSAERLSKLLGKEFVTSYRASNKNQSFFLSINFANRRESVVQTFQEEKWVFAPRRFMTLSAPTRDNNFKATAVIVKKSSAEPSHAHVQGAIARKVWLIPDVQLLTPYYEKGYRLASPTIVVPPPEAAAPLPMEERDESMSSLEQNTFISPVFEPVLPAYSELSEDEGGEDNFTWEEVEDDSLPWAEDAIPPPPMPAPPRRRQSSFASTLDNAPEVLPQKPVRRNEPKPPVRTKELASEENSSTEDALPALPPLPAKKSSPVKASSAGEEQALPAL